MANEHGRNILRTPITEPPRLITEALLLSSLKPEMLSKPTKNICEKHPLIYKFTIEIFPYQKSEAKTKFAVNLDSSKSLAFNESV